MAIQNEVSHRFSTLNTYFVEQTNRNKKKSVASSPWAHQATLIAKIVGIVLASAAVCSGTGLLLQAGGRGLTTLSSAPCTLSVVSKTVGAWLTYGGEGIFLIGKGAFLSIAVPIYACCWVLPKWTITTGIPQAVHLTHIYVLLPVGKGIIQASKLLTEQALKLARVIYNYALVPLAKATLRSAQWIWKSAILPIMKGLIQALDAVQTTLVRCARAIYRFALIPIANGVARSAIWIWKAVLIPTANAISQVFHATLTALSRCAQTIFHSVLIPIAKGIARNAAWIWKAVLIPTANAISQAFDATFTALSRCTQTIFGSVLIPIAKGIARSAVWIWKAVLIPTANAISQAFDATLAALSRYVQAIYSYALFPLGKALGQGSKWIWQAMILPAIREILKVERTLVNSIMKSAQSVYRFSVLLFNEITNTLKKINFEAIQWTIQTSKAMMDSVQEGFFWISRNVAHQ
jgi:hypothetical protein